jgi:hypothetical protein
MMERHIEPEWLDELPEDDPHAQRSRRDLRRVNWVMGQGLILRRGLARAALPPPRVIVELGAGDGSLMLRLASRLRVDWPGVKVILLDRQPVVPRRTLDPFKSLGWEVEVIRADLFDWLAHPSEPEIGLMLANLVVHHFSPEQLKELFIRAAQTTQVFLACEPRRSAVALWGSRMLWTLGCNAVTRHDAVLSVRAGFAGQELSGLWPKDGAWSLEERPAGLFSHCFLAVRQNGQE